ncbi:hypothetical protein [Leptospira kanakyensis]|uniref:hypothetical protein n=1 Tax=Leptospira kanakyensis TaxID=2484968 RepID=UPI001FCA05DF|nr:hypothetical protein [Leptospira kanakyensis]
MVRIKTQSRTSGKESKPIFAFILLFCVHCIYLKQNDRKDPAFSPTSLSDRESYLVLRLVRGKDKTIGLVEEISVTLAFENLSGSTKQSLRIHPLPLAESKEPFFLPLSTKTKYKEETLLVGCLYFFPIPHFFRGNLKLEIHHVQGIADREFVFQKIVPYDWQGNLTKYWEYDLDHSEITDKIIPSLSSYRHLECEDDIRHRKEIPKNGVVSPPEED